MSEWWHDNPYLFEQITTVVFLCAVVVIVVLLVFGSKLPPRECSEYANSLMKDVPARCMEYWTNPR